MLREQPLILHTRNGGIKKIGGPDQCTDYVLRCVLARFNNWTKLVREVVKAELPWFEAFSSLSTLLQLEDRAPEFEKAAKNLGGLLSVSPAALQQDCVHVSSLKRLPCLEPTRMT